MYILPVLGSRNSALRMGRNWKEGEEMKEGRLKEGRKAGVMNGRKELPSRSGRRGRWETTARSPTPASSLLGLS
jgi:hypothetical protein